MSKIVPAFDYLLCEQVKEETGAMTSSAIDDHWQKYRVLAVAKEGRVDHGILVKAVQEIGDIIYVQKHAEADTPQDLKDKGQYLIAASRVMATEAK